MNPMTLLPLLLLSVGLAADATAASISSAVAAPRVRARDALLVAAFFGGAQGLMPVLGWAIGARFAARIEAWDHWVVFVLLGGIGAKMIHDALGPSEGEGEGGGEATAARNPFALGVVAVMALATSIDALAAGVTLPLLGFRIGVAAGTIAAVTFALSYAGGMLGRRLGTRFGRRFDVVGGVLLIALGARTLIEHLA